MQFSKRLKELRTKNNVTQQELAKYIGVGRPAVAGYETKGNHPDYDKLKLIAKLFNVSTDYLLGVTDICEPISSNEKISNNLEECYYDDLPVEAKKELDIFIDYLKFKYKDNN